MAICYECAEEIEFRYIDGRRTPIHLHGGWCSGSSDSSLNKPFQTRESYTDPNARCPVCGEPVFFYQSPNGGRVFFDDLGWPWPKHSCTDNPKSQSGVVEILKTSRSKPFVNKNGDVLSVCNVTRSIEKEDFIILFINTTYHPFKEHRVKLDKNSMAKANIIISDIKDAPSFVVRSDGDFWRISFISGRRKKIINMKLQKMQFWPISARPG